MGSSGASAAGGGGATHSYLGKTAVGASNELMTQYRHYVKKVTLAAAGTITSVQASIKGTNSNAENIRMGIWLDNAGTPGDLIAFGGCGLGATGIYLESSGGGANSNQRWMSVAMGRYLTAADYWIGVMSGGSVNLNLAYDTGGSDRIWTSTIDDITDGGNIFAITDSTRDYSIRADVLS